MKVNFITFGCKVNIYETENMKENFSSQGFTITDNESDCDIYVINTCTVTSYSDKKIRQTIHRLRRNNPSALIVLTGCFPQAFAKEAEEISEADIITGTKNRAVLPQLIKDYLNEKSRIVSISEYGCNDSFEKMENLQYADKTRAFLKIQDGCNMFCTYCIIPYSRGRFRSKAIEDIIIETTALAQNGYKEVVLVGINLCFYGVEFGKRLIDAIEAVCNVDGIERVRLGSLEPAVISDEDIAKMASLKKLCPQFHLSLQSGCDRTLKAMNRKYTSEEYESIITKLRSAFDNCSITTDIMVGFPDETEEDFKQSLEFVEKIGFSKAHIFPYSRRSGTPADKMENQVPEHIKTERAEKMKEITDISHKEFLQSQVGKTCKVLFERAKISTEQHGYTPNYTKVKILSENPLKSLRNEILYVKIEKLVDDYCLGTIIN